MKKTLLLVAIAFLVNACGSDDSNNTELLCAIPTVNLVNIETDGVSVDWDQTNATSATLEYGPSGFSVGAGTTISSSQSFIVNGLTPDTSYDVYVNVSCGNGGISDNAGPFVFTTNPCATVGIDIYNIEPFSAFVEFNSGNNDTVVFEYGETGFQIGTGTSGQTANGGIQIDNLSPVTTYDIYVSRVCGTELSIATMATFTTDSLCQEPSGFDGFPFGSGNVEIYWNPNGETAWEIEYGLSGFQIGTGTIVNTSNSVVDITGLQSATVYEFYVRANCGSDGYSAYVGALTLVTN